MSECQLQNAFIFSILWISHHQIWPGLCFVRRGHLPWADGFNTGKSMLILMKNRLKIEVGAINFAIQFVFFNVAACFLDKPALLVKMVR